MNIEPTVAHFRAVNGEPLDEPPIERGVYRALISWFGDAYYMGTSREVELVIRNR